MKDIKEFIKKGENGEFTIDYEAYKAELNSELDRARTQASETAKNNAEKTLRSTIEKEIKEKLEAEAKLSAEEKLKQEREAFALEKKEFDKKRIKQMYADAGIGEAEIEILCGLIGDDSEKNIETATKFAEARKTANEDAEKRFKEKMQQNGVRVDGSNGSGSDDDNIGAKMAKLFSDKNEGNGYIDLNARHNGGEVKIEK